MPRYIVHGRCDTIYLFDAEVTAKSKKEARHKVKNFEWDDLNPSPHPEYRIFVGRGDVDEMTEEEDEDEEEEGGRKAPDPKPEKLGTEPGR